jgi:ABC-type glutathione transport system ATPase component
MAATKQPEEMRQTELELTGDELLVAQDVKKYFPITRGIVFQKEVASVKAVDGVSFALHEGETSRSSRARRCARSGAR